MMYTLLHYLLRVTIIWIVLLAYYSLTQRNNGNWPLRRRLLLSSYWLGLLIPLLPVYSVPEAVQGFSISGRVQVGRGVGFTELVSESYVSWSLLFLLLYLKVAVLLGGSKILLLARSLRWKYQSEFSYFGRFPVIHHQKVISPFAAWGCIYLPADLLAGEACQTAMIHEAKHLEKHHPLEQLLLLPGSILLWFHPLQWVFNRWQSDLHEYEVDEAVTAMIPTKVYALQLIQSSQYSGISWPPHFFSSSLKKRIHRMTNSLTSRSFNPGQFITLLGLILLLTVACSDLKEEIVTLPTFESPFELGFTDQFPRLITDDPADATKSNEQLLVEAIYGQVSYPKQAREIGLTGNYELTVLVEPDGSAKVNSVCSVTEDQVNKDKQLVVVGYGQGVDETFPVEEELFLISEAYDLMDHIGPFIPSTKDGVAARSLLHFYLTFKLENDDE